MGREKPQKVKLLILEGILRSETDPEHPMKTEELCKKLGDMGITCDRRVLARDIEILKSFGFDIRRKYVAHSYAYFMEGNAFKIAELKIIVDALQAATFLPESLTDELVGRIADLGGVYKNELLEDGIVSFNLRKHTNEDVYENVAALESAIKKKSKAIFNYFDLNEKKKRIYRKDGDFYTVEPIVLIYHEDLYYLVAYSSKYKNYTTYRIDRMENVTVIDEPVTKVAERKILNPANVTKQTFKMFGGVPCKVTLTFPIELLGAVYDKFGESIKVTRTEDTCTIKVTVQLSPTFYGWIFQFAGKMRIVEPDEVIVEYREMCRKVLENI